MTRVLGWLIAVNSSGGAPESDALVTSMMLASLLFWFVIVPAAFIGWRRKRRLAAMVRELQAQGFAVNTKRQRRPKLPFTEFERHRGKVTFQITRVGSWDSAFLYQYSEGSGDQRTTVRLSCALIPVPFTAASVSIAASGRSLFGRWAKHRVETDSIRFNERFTVTSDDERFAYTMLSYEVVEWIMNAPPVVDGATLRWAEGWMLIARPAVAELELPELLATAASLRERLPPVLTSLYPPTAPSG